jgi:hypothetical protein
MPATLGERTRWQTDLSARRKDGALGQIGQSPGSQRFARTKTPTIEKSGLIHGRVGFAHLVRLRAGGFDLN